jgi:hypothetical protein
LGLSFWIKETETVKNFIKTHFNPLLEEIIKTGRLKDYKSLLQEKIQAQEKPAPIYKTIKEEGPEHDKIFTVNVIVENKILATGKGKSKQKAEQQAAQKSSSISLRPKNGDTKKKTVKFKNWDFFRQGKFVKIKTLMVKIRLAKNRR